MPSAPVQSNIECVTHPGDPVVEEEGTAAIEAESRTEAQAGTAQAVEGGVGMIVGQTAPPESSRRSETLGDVPTAAIYRELLRRIGEDPSRDGLLRTPERMEKSMTYLTRGYGQTVEEVLHNALFDVDYDEMVIVKDIEFYSMCEHHLLPFFGRAHVAYVPHGKVIGLSKIPRLVDVFARRLQVQERMTRQVADAITDAIQPQGVAVILEAQHLCMMMRGVEKQSSITTTSAMLGVFKSQLQTRNEFLALIHRGGASA